MDQEGTTRKLAAILSADVKQYSRLRSQDERGTIRTSSCRSGDRRFVILIPFPVDEC